MTGRAPPESLLLRQHELLDPLQPVLQRAVLVLDLVEVVAEVLQLLLARLPLLELPDRVRRAPPHAPVEVARPRPLERADRRRVAEDLERLRGRVARAEE